MTLGDLNSRNALLRKKMFYGAQQKNLKKDRPILSAAKCSRYTRSQQKSSIE